jgi:sugar (pentulose or hexulose) kinase
LPLQRAVITGGAGRSSNWAQIQANIYGIPTVLPNETDAAAVGAAILAGLGAEVYPTVQAGVDQLVKIDKVFSPQADKVEIYEMLSNIQVQAYNSLMNGGVYEMLHEFRNRLGTHE